MPINLETPTGFFDGSGVFHPNTQVTPTPVPGVYGTAPIDPSQPYDPWPVVEPYIPGKYFPTLPKFPDLPKLPDFGGAIEASSNLANGLGILSGSLGLLLFAGGAYLLAKNQRWIK